MSIVCVVSLFAGSAPALGCDRGLLHSAESAAEALDERWEYRDGGGGQAKSHSYLDAIRSGLECSAAAPSSSSSPSSSYPEVPQTQLCPYAAAGQCHYGSNCPYLHGDLCEICRLQVLHPLDPEQRRAHEKVRALT